MDFCDAIQEENGLIYLLDTKNGLVIANFSDTKEPEIVGRYFFNKTEDNIEQIFSSDVILLVENNYSYIFREDIVDIINCTNPIDPQRVSRTIMDFHIMDAGVEDNTLLIGGYQKLVIYNIENDFSLMNRNQLTGKAINFEIKNDLLYMVRDDFEVVIHSIGGSISQVGTLVIGSEIEDLCLDETILYVQTRNAVYLIDVSNPAEMETMTIFQSASGYRIPKLKVLNNKFYIMRGDTIEVVNCTLKSNLQKIGEYTCDVTSIPIVGYTMNYPQITDITVQNEQIYLALTSKGLDIVGMDYDNDNVADSEEQTNYLTNALKRDTDSDGLDDGYEITMGLNPLDDSDADLDPDGDGLENTIEYFHNTDPFETDTDHDNLRDNEEIDYKTNPTDHDSDKDGLMDGFEIKTSGTNPLKMDTDRDTITDFMELAGGTNPLIWSRWGILFGLYLVPIYIVIIIVSIVLVKRRKRRLMK